MNTIFSKVAPFIFTLVLLGFAGCSMVDDSGAENSEIIHYHVDLNEVDLTTADSAVIDVWQGSDPTPVHQAFTDMDNVIPTINAVKDVMVTLFVRVYKSGDIVGAMRHEFIAGERVNAKSLVAMNLTMERYAGPYDTVAFWEDYASFGFAQASCKVEGTTDVGNCALLFNAEGDHAYSILFSDGLRQISESVRVHVLQGSPVIGHCPNLNAFINTSISFGICQASDTYPREIAGGIAMYLWDYNGDGVDEDSSDGLLFSHAYANASRDTSYVARLTVRDNDGNVATATRKVHVTNRSPVLGMIISNEILYTTQKTTLTAPIIADADHNQIDSLWWDLDGDGTYETKAPGGVAQEVSFTTMGTYTVGAYAWDVWGEADTVTFELQVDSSFVDSRDGQIYSGVKIGTQVWLKENLNVGAMVLGAGSAAHQEDNDRIEKYCYGDTAAHCATYGGLYQWAEAMGLPSTCNSTECASRINSGHHQGICPMGWHIPKTAEWDLLATYLGGTAMAGGKMKSTTGWSTNKGANTSGFSALPAGARYSSGNFLDRGDAVFFWEAKESDAPSAFYRNLLSGDANLNANDYNKTYGRSVRCLRDD